LAISLATTIVQPETTLLASRQQLGINLACFGSIIIDTGLHFANESQSALSKFKSSVSCSTSTGKFSPWSFY
jgi:hypothetical protein